MTTNPLSELRSFLASMWSEVRRRPDPAAQNDVRALQDIAADATAQQATAARTAYSAEQADLEAARLLRESLADGKVTADEIPFLRRALRHVTRSAERDHHITDVLHA